MASEVGVDHDSIVDHVDFPRLLQTGEFEIGKIVQELQQWVQYSGLDNT